MAASMVNTANWVVLWADVHPMIGMFMLPKTCMYIWIVCMGYMESRRKNETVQSS